MTLEETNRSRTPLTHKIADTPVRDAAIIGDRRTVATVRIGGVGAATPAP